MKVVHKAKLLLGTLSFHDGDTTFIFSEFKYFVIYHRKIFIGGLSYSTDEGLSCWLLGT
jgi:hypothetical protein